MGGKGGILVFSIFLMLYLDGESIAQTKTKRFEYSQRHMGTLFRIVLYSSDSIKANQAVNAAFGRVAILNSILSDYEKDSELNQLCRTAGTNTWVPVSSDLWDILQKSGAVSKETDGAFDITVGPYVQLWRRARRQNQLPSPKALAEAKKAVGYQYILFDKRRKAVQLTQPNMQLDMGAIGKGYAVDEALKILKAHNIKHALVDGGGNIVVSKAPPGVKGWEIALEPLHPQDQPQKIYLKHKAVATSGDLYQFIEFDGVRYSHILNPFTGLGLTDRSRVIIIARDGTTADWLSTALSVLGPDKGRKLNRRATIYYYTIPE